MKKHIALALICLSVLAFAPSAHALGLEAYTMEAPEAWPLDETIEWLETNTPEIMADLEKIKKLDQQTYEEILLIGTEEVPYAELIKDDDPIAFKRYLATARMDVHSELLALQYIQSKDKSEKKKLKKELHNLTEQIFDARMGEHAQMVKEIEAELQELKHMGKVRVKNRDKIIKRHMDDLTSSEADSLEWW